MARSHRNGTLVAVVAAVVLLSSPLPVLADFAINILCNSAACAAQGTYDVDGLTVHDNQPGDANPLLGAITVFAGGSIPAIPGFLFNVDRSEERRVGKVCRCWLR